MTFAVGLGRPAVRMQGSVSLENNGDLIQIALDPAPGGHTVDASGFRGITIDVLGNGDAYGIHLWTPDLTRPWQSYRASFVAKDTWESLQLPFVDFVPHCTDVPLDMTRLRRLFIVAIGRNFTPDLFVGGVSFH